MNDCKPVELFNWHGVKAMTYHGGRPFNFLFQQKFYAIALCSPAAIGEIISSTYLLSRLLMLAIKYRSHTEGKKIIALSVVLFIWSSYTQLITSKLAAACVPFAPGFARLLI